MVVNLNLIDQVHLEPGDDSMGRSWYGFRSSWNAEELWTHNRGQYRLNRDRLTAEQVATMSYRGTVVVVAALTGWEPYPGADGSMQTALVGDVLGPGDPDWDYFHARNVPGKRGQFYLDIDDYGPAGVDAPTDTDRANLTARGSSQGWQSDPVRRKHVEDAAQDRLMAHYRDRGWDVTDTRFGESYDAVAKRKNEVVYLEAKGTETSGTSVIVTVGEVNHARKNPGRCVMGILSDIAFDQAGNVDPASGTFVILPFDPQDEALTATGFRWRLPNVGN